MSKYEGEQKNSSQNEEESDERQEVESHDPSEFSQYTLEDNLLAQAKFKNRIQNTQYKWLFLFLLSTASYGVFFSTNIVSNLREEAQKTFQLDDLQLNMLYTYSNLINIVFAFTNGIIIDIIGQRLGLIIFLACGLISISLQTIGTIFDNYGWFLAGFLFNNTVLEATVIAQSALCSKWFIGNFLTFSLGIIAINWRVAEVLCSFFAARLYNIRDSLEIPLYAGVFMYLFSFIVSSFGVFYMDRKNEQATFANLANENQKNNINKPNSPYKQNNHLFNSSFFENQELSKQILQQQQFEQQRAVRRVNFKDIKNLRLLFWLVIILQGLGMNCYYNFICFVEKILEDKFKMNDVQAGQTISIPFFIAFISPVVGFTIDRVGKRPQILLFAFFILSLNFIIWILLPQCNEYSLACSNMSYIPMAFLGIFLGITSSTIIAAIPLIIDQKFLGTGLGIASSMKSIIVSLGSLLSGYIAKNLGENYIFWLFFAIASSGFILAIFIYINDKDSGGVLVKYTKEKQIIKLNMIKDIRTQSYLRQINLRGDSNIEQDESSQQLDNSKII